MKTTPSSPGQTSGLPNRMQQLAGAIRRHRAPAWACLIMTSALLATVFYITRPPAAPLPPPMIAVADPLPAASEAPAESVTPFPPTPVDVLTVHGAAGAKANS